MHRRPYRFFFFIAFGIVALTGCSSAARAQSAEYGLEWPGDGAVRRMLYWHNPFPIYDATYVFRVYPRRKTGQYTYYTTFFWGNDGTFTWDSGSTGNTYYGAHPYPIPAPHGAGQWEISVHSDDYVTGTEVDWNRWHTQAFRAWRESPAVTHHEFYWDWPDTTKVIKQTIVDTGWANRNPPKPAIVIGQAPNLNGASWGGYPGWEEFSGVIRGIQIYSGLLSMADLQAEIAAPMSTTTGRNLIWYLNLNPRPGDVTDKKGIGTPHSPSWAGTTALEWTGSAPDQPSLLAISNVSATNVTTSGATIAWTTNQPADSVVDYGTTSAYGQVTPVDPAQVTAHSINLSGLTASTTYHYRARSTDGAGNSAASSDSTFTTGGVVDTTPPLISDVAASNITTSSATIIWKTNEPADSVVDYGPTSAYGQTTPVNPSLVTSHSMSLSALSANTTYHFRVRSKDAASNSAHGADSMFTTPGQAGTVAALAAYGFNETSGPTTADASGHGFNGTLVNGPLRTSGHSGNALSFDGVNDKVSLPGTLDVPRLPFTVEAWVNPSSRSDWGAILSKRDSYFSTQMRFDVGLAISSGRVYVNTYRSFITFGYAPPQNTWTHVAVVAESTGTKLYVNGVLRETATSISLGNSSTAKVTIGNTGDDDDPFAGQIDDLRLYDRSLSGSEIQADMIAGVP